MDLDTNQLIRYAVGGLLISATIFKPFRAYSTVLGVAALYLIITAGTEYYPESSLIRF